MIRIIFRVLFVSLIITGVALAVSYGFIHFTDATSVMEFKSILGWVGIVPVVISLILFSSGSSTQYDKPYTIGCRTSFMKIPVLKDNKAKSDTTVSFDISGICFFITGALVWAIAYYM